MRTRELLTISSLLLLPTLAISAPTPAQKCAFAKIKAAVKATKSQANCYKPVFLKNEVLDPACLARVSEKLAVAFAKAESAGGCATPNDLAEFQSDVDLCTDAFLTVKPKSCGDTAGTGGGDVPCACGDTVATNTTLVSEDSVTTTTCTGDGLTLAAGVHLDLNGLTIGGSGGGNGLSVPSGGMISNGSVRGFGVGLHVGGGAAASLVTVAGVIIEQNAGNGATIEVVDGQSRVVFDGVIVQANGGHGIHVRSAPGASNLDADEVLAQSNFGFSLRNASVISGNTGDGIHLGDSAQPADVAAMIGDEFVPQDIYGNLGAGIVMEQKAGLLPGADCGASAGQPGCTGALIVNSRFHDNGGAGVELRGGFMIPFDASGLGFRQNFIFHNAMSAAGCIASQSVAQIYVTAPVGLSNAECASATELECASLSVAGNNRHCLWTGACQVAWDLRGSLTTLGCADANKIFGYSTGPGPNDVGIRAIAAGLDATSVLATNTTWVGAPKTSVGGGSAIATDPSCSSIGCSP